MGSKSDYAENKTLDAWLGNTAIPANATVYVALLTVTPSDSGGGTEVTGGSYARVAKTNNAANWPNAAGGSKSNGTDIVFPTPTAGWGNVVAWAIYDASTGGNLIYWGAITGGPITVNSGDTPVQFDTGALVITED